MRLKEYGAGEAMAVIEGQHGKSLIKHFVEKALVGTDLGSVLFYLVGGKE